MPGIKDWLYQALRIVKPTLEYRSLAIPTQNPPVTRQIFKQLALGRYEVPELNALHAILRDGDRVLELGSGLGIVSSLASRARLAVTVRTYEANPDLVSFIRQVHTLNGIVSVELRNEVLIPAPEQKSMYFHIHPSFAESSILEHNSVLRKVAVECRDLNEVLAEFRPDVFLCDIEGGEERVFNGIDLTGIRALVIELHPTVISRTAVKRIFEACADAGLYPRVEWSAGMVVAFERVDPP